MDGMTEDRWLKMA